MNLFEKATRLKLRVNTPKGLLSVEQLWDLNLTTLAESIKVYKQEVKREDDLDFLLEESTTIDEKIQLSFDVLKSIYLTKKQEQISQKETAEIKAHNAKIDELIFKRKQAEMEALSIEELLKLKK